MFSYNVLIDTSLFRSHRYECISFISRKSDLVSVNSRLYLMKAVLQFDSESVIVTQRDSFFTG